jgi:hypothetical protein
MIILLYCRLQIRTYRMDVDVAAFRIRFRIRLPLIVVFQKMDSIIEFFVYCIQHCFIYHPPNSNWSEDAGIESRNVASVALAVRRSIISRCEYRKIPLDCPVSTAIQ